MGLGISVRSPWVRWGALVWLAIWLPAYWRTWGPVNFLHLSDVALILTCIGLWRTSRLLLSSQAVGSLIGFGLWMLDVACRLLIGVHLFGGTEYMWDARFPLWVRLLSLFHIVMPIVLLWALRDLGYDGRGLALQLGVAAAVLAASLFVDPARNLNFVYRDPLFGRTFGPQAAHVLAILAALVGLLYLPTHLLLVRAFPPRSQNARGVDSAA